MCLIQNNRAPLRLDFYTRIARFLKQAPCGAFRNEGNWSRDCHQCYVHAQLYYLRVVGNSERDYAEDLQLP